MDFNEEALATSSPIRKPQYKLKYQSKSHRSFALKSLERLILLNGRLHWVDVKLDFSSLSELIGKMSSHDWACFPESDCKSLQFNSKREVTFSELNALNHAVLNWSRRLDQLTSRHEFKSELKSQRLELANVGRRVSFLFDQLHDRSRVRSAEALRGSIILDEKQEVEFERLFSKAKHGSPMWNSSTRNLARFVYWYGDLNAFQRFSNAINRVPGGTSRFLYLLERAMHWTKGLQKRLESESGYSVRHDFDNNALNDEVHDWMRKRELSRESRGKIGQRLESALENYSAAYDLVSIRMAVKLPSLLAAYALCVEQGTELVQYSIDYAFEIEPVNQLSLKHVASTQIELSQSPSYARFVRFVNASTEQVRIGSRSQEVLSWIEDGFDFDDIQFVLENEISIADGIKLRPVRKSAERYHRLFGRRPENASFSSLHGHLKSSFPMEAVDRVVRWLEIFPREVFTRGLCERTIGVLRLLIDIGEIEEQKPAITNILNEWSSRSQQVRDCFPDEANHPKELRSWLRRLTYFQRLSGASVRVPVSVKKFLDGPRRQRLERQHLTELQKVSELNHKQFCRLESLKDKPFDQKRFDRKATLLVMESCVLSAMESLRSLLLNLTRQVWDDATGYEFPADWSDHRCIEFALWVETMKPAEKRLLRQIFTAYHRHGENAKKQQPFNRSWIASQKESGYRVDQWLNPPVEEVRVGRQRFAISICHDPCEVFLMGVLFNTCLAPGGCNEMSVLANAADANKQVLYVRDEQGQIVARKLLAVSRKNELLGYYCYVSSEDSCGKDVCTSIQEFVSQYCGRLAAKVGWSLADEGTAIGLGHFWYDDGEVAWEVAATEARIRARVQLASALAYQPPIRGFAVSHQ